MPSFSSIDDRSRFTSYPPNKLRSPPHFKVSAVISMGSIAHGNRVNGVLQQGRYPEACTSNKGPGACGTRTTIFSHPSPPCGASPIMKRMHAIGLLRPTEADRRLARTRQGTVTNLRQAVTPPAIISLAAGFLLGVALPGPKESTTDNGY